ncbi:MAG: hypothetical protein BWX88_03901 [Planctomycetes bacterium ADurb.Bin126]|nr:MAG: hypothetical protein BWX88_03901 [Planctomycetes bacterium ADurb.Bin126]
MKHVIGCMAVLAGLGLLAGNWTHETTMWIGGMCQAAASPSAVKEPLAGKDYPAGAYELPKPQFIGTRKDIRERFLRPPRVGPLLRPAMPLACRNLAAGKTVTSSDSEPFIGELKLVTDGDKEAMDGSFVELGPGKQWVQIDLGQPAAIHVIHFWHFHADGRVYRDVVVQVADDADFIENVRTLFNNDYDNSSGLGIGKDLQYVDNHEGEIVRAGGLKARYVRLYSNGNTADDRNHYIEVEVWGLPSK